MRTAAACPQRKSSSSTTAAEGAEIVLEKGEGKGLQEAWEREEMRWSVLASTEERQERKAAEEMGRGRS